MSFLKEQLRTYALSQGAHVAGFAPASTFADAPAGFRPVDIMPKAKTVIVLGKALSKGTVLAANKAVYTMQGATIIQELDALAQMEGVNKVLDAAALTYVAAAIQALSTILYYVFLLTGRSSNRD